MSEEVGISPAKTASSLAVGGTRPGRSAAAAAAASLHRDTAVSRAHTAPRPGDYAEVRPPLQTPLKGPPASIRLCLCLLDRPSTALETRPSLLANTRRREGDLQPAEAAAARRLCQETRCRCRRSRLVGRRDDRAGDGRPSVDASHAQIFTAFVPALHVGGDGQRGDRIGSQPPLTLSRSHAHPDIHQAEEER